MEIEAAQKRGRGRPRSFDRDEALAKAMELFWRHGYESTSISELTAAMGINPPSLYATFGDKERLFLEAVGRYECGSGAARRALDEAPTAREAFAGFLRETAVELTASCHPPGCMLVTSAMSCSAASDHLRDALRERRAAAESHIKARLRRAVRDGELARGTNVAALAKFFMTVTEGMTIQARDGATRDALVAVAEAAMRGWPAAE